MSRATAVRWLSLASGIAIVGITWTAGTKAQTPGAGQPTEKIEVTGSHIKRAEAETAENIQIITSQDIQRSGQQTVADYLRNISANFAAFNETFVNSFAAGAAGLALRGLSQKNTLVLLNGRRIANYGFAQNLEDTFVDLNVIPVSAVERIEVLKSGAAAIYGSDATAGVVNIILKQKSTDKMAGGGGSLTEEGGGATRDAWLSLGFGDFASDGWNVFATGTVFKRSDITANERGYTAAQDFRNINAPDGILSWINSGSYSSNANPTAPNVPFATCGTPGVPGRVVPSSAFPGIATGSQCAYNPANQFSLDPATERANLTTTFNLKLPADWTAFGDVFYSDVKTTARFSPSQINSNSIAFNPATGGARVVPNTLPAGNPSNPNLGAPTQNTDGSQDFTYTFNPVGGRDYAVWSNTYRVSGGVKGSWLNWDWELAYGHSQNDVVQVNYNSINVNNLTAAIASGSYNFLSPTPASVAALRLDFGQESISKLDTAGLKGTGALFDLPAGPLSAAAGAEFRHESIDNEPDSQLLSGDVLNFGINKLNGARSVYAGYAEVDAPILKGLEADLAAREEHYGDVGANFSPRAELRWQPSSTINLRATASKGFRAPSLPEISHASSLSFQTVTDPLDPLQRATGYAIGVVTQANPNLKPETSKNVDFGIVLSPTANFNVSLDYYRISVDHVVATETTAQNIVNVNAANPAAFPGQVVRTPAGFIADVSVPYANVYQIVTSGYDFEGHATFPLQDAAKLHFDLMGTYISQMAVFNGSAWTDYAGTNGWLYASPISGGGPMPHLKGSLSGTWENPSWVGSATVHHIGTYHNYCQEFGICSNPASFTTASNTTLDLFGEYKGLKHWDFRFSVVNLFNVAPPFDDLAMFFNGYESYDQTLYDPRGRVMDLHVQYTF